MEKQTILILGATSAIARAAAFCWAKRGYNLYLASRDKHELERISADISIRCGVVVRHSVFDIGEFSTHESFIGKVLEETSGNFCGVLLAAGYLGNQATAVTDFGEAKKIIDVNYIGACSILTQCANVLIGRKETFIAAISSVAGDRGRQSNYVYGSAKAGLNVFLEGMRNRLFPQGVHVLTIKPGFVDTAMTYGRPGMFLVASPELVAETIVKAVDKRKNIVYIPWFWRIIMGIIQSIPECIFKRLKL